jgi:hypothetical protein
MAAGPLPTIEILIRDEVSAALERQRQKLRSQDQRASFQKTRLEIQGLEAAGERFKREIGTLLSMTGITAFFGSGMVAGIAQATQALGGLARESINSRYTAQALGLTVEQFNKCRSQTRVVLSRSNAAITRHVLPRMIVRIGELQNGPGAPCCRPAHQIAFEEQLFGRGSSALTASMRYGGRYRSFHKRSSPSSSRQKTYPVSETIIDVVPDRQRRHPLEALT